MPREIALLVNPVAGRGRGLRVAERVTARLRDAGFDVHQVAGRDADEALDLAHAVVADQAESLVVVGGDGMAHLAVQATAGSSTSVGVIPTGTGNDVARFLGVPLRDPEAAADVVVAGRSERFDLARAGSQYYLTVLAAGFDSKVNERANQMRWPTGHSRYALATLAELRVFEPLRYTLELDGERHDRPAMLVAVGNGPSYGGGLRMCEGADPADGLLDVVVVDPVSKVELVRVYPRLFHGGHLSHPAIRRHRVRRVSLASPGVVAYADGERLGALPLTVEVAPHAARLFAAQQRPGAEAAQPAGGRARTRVETRPRPWARRPAG